MGNIDTFDTINSNLLDLALDYKDTVLKVFNNYRNILKLSITEFISQNKLDGMVSYDDENGIKHFGHLVVDDLNEHNTKTTYLGTRPIEIVFKDMDEDNFADFACEEMHNQDCDYRLVFEEILRKYKPVPSAFLDISDLCDTKE